MCFRASGPSCAHHCGRCLPRLDHGAGPDPDGRRASPRRTAALRSMSSFGLRRPETCTRTSVALKTRVWWSSSFGRGCSTSSGGSSPMPVRRPLSGVMAGFSTADSVRYATERPTGAARDRFLRSASRDPIVPRSASGAGNPAAGRSRAQQGERLSRDARQPGRTRGSRRLRADAISAPGAGSVRHRARRPVRRISPRQAGREPGRIRRGSIWRETPTGRRRVLGSRPLPLRDECSKEASSVGAKTHF